MADLSPRPIKPATSTPEPAAFVPPLDIARSTARQMLNTYSNLGGDTVRYAEAYGALQASLRMVLDALDAEAGENQ